MYEASGRSSNWRIKDKGEVARRRVYKNKAINGKWTLIMRKG